MPEASCCPGRRAQQINVSDEGGRVLALETAWNHALEEKDAKALDMLLANTMYQPGQAVTEQSTVQVYGNAAVVVGIFRIKGTEKGKPYVRRERFVDTWVKFDGTWQCLATTSALITAKQQLAD